MDESILEKVYKFTAEQTGVKVQELTPETSLEIDLGVTGDDGGAFILEFSKFFNVDVSTCWLDYHFLPERDDLLSILYSILRAMFTMLPARPEKQIIPIRMLDLAIAIEQGHWPFKYPEPSK